MKFASALLLVNIVAFSNAGAPKVSMPKVSVSLAVELMRQTARSWFSQYLPRCTRLDWMSEKTLPEKLLEDWNRASNGKHLELWQDLMLRYAPLLLEPLKLHDVITNDGSLSKLWFQIQMEYSKICFITGRFQCRYYQHRWSPFPIVLGKDQEIFRRHCWSQPPRRCWFRLYGKRCLGISG